MVLTEGEPMQHLCAAVCLAAVISVAAGSVAAQEKARDLTCFQTGSGYLPAIDTGSDVAIVYGVGNSFAERAKSWQDRGYTVSLMTGIAWGGYDSYYGTGDAFKKDEVQTDRRGELFMHGHSTTVGYNVPSAAYVEYIKRYIDPALDYGIQGLYLEEPEYWARTGWSEAFKREWEIFYGEPWQPPDSSPDAQYRASKLKYELYFDALKEVFGHAERRAKEKAYALECHVPTHSLVNYAQWRIVSPESHLIDIEELDGYIAQVWTGTARSRNLYRGVGKERTFETAYLEYGQMLGMVRPTGKKVWFLADPIEDNPNHSWSDYKTNYECTVVASLLWPEVSRFEVMPWPGRIFKGTYPKTDLDTKSGEREGIPATYATQILTVINALNDMDQDDVTYDAGSQGIGVIVSDTLMFQRAAPDPSDASLASFYALALPLLKHGIPVEIVQLENTLHPACLERYDVLLLTYEGQKPLKPEYHEALEQWVRAGGGLVYIGDGSDPYHGVREWWNEQGKSDAKAYDDLFKRLGIGVKARTAPEPVGKGHVRVLAERPRELAAQEDGPSKVLALLREMRTCMGKELDTRNYLCLRRGPYVIAAVLDESISEEPLRLEGSYVDIFDAALPIVNAKSVAPNERILVYDLDWARKRGVPKVLAAATRVRNEKYANGAFTFTTRGPESTHANVRVFLPSKPERISTTPSIDLTQEWDPSTSTILLSFDNSAQDTVIQIEE